MLRKIFTYAVTAGLALTLTAGCDSDGDDTTGAGSAAPSVSSAAPTPADPPADPSATPADPSATPADPSATPPAESPATPTETPTTPAAPAPQKIRLGAEGAKVTAVQDRLGELGYWNGTPDGNFGGRTQQAVYALQKAAGLTRDGVVGPKTQRALDRGVRPKARSGDGYVIEIDKRRQLLMLVNDGRVEQVFNTSTGSYERYEQDGTTHVASTPDGRFRVSRQIDGWRDAPLGLLWRPKYFNGGIAVHGARSVPPYAASHGCARLSIAAMNYLWTNDRIPLRTRVWVY